MLLLHDIQGIALPESPSSAIGKSNQYHCENQSYSEMLYLTQSALPDSKALPDSGVRQSRLQFVNFRMSQIVSESIIWTFVCLGEYTKIDDVLNNQQKFLVFNTFILCFVRKYTWIWHVQKTTCFVTKRIKKFTSSHYHITGTQPTFIQSIIWKMFSVLLWWPGLIS